MPDVASFLFREINLLFLKFKTHNIYMIYIFSLIAGIVNGLFASGAGQIVVFFLIYILKVETHTARATSIFCVVLTTIITLIKYFKFTNLNISQVITVLLIGAIFGMIGSKIMKRIPSNYLNIFSGILIVSLALYNLIKR